MRRHLRFEAADVTIVLGSGLSGVSEIVTDARSVAYAAVPGFPKATASGHPGRIVAGNLGDKTCVLLCGRIHQYEGYRPSQIGFSVRVAAALGTSILIVTNASGGIDHSFVPGEIVAISDQINLTSESPLMGRNDERLGPRFLDMSQAYDPDLRRLAILTAPAVVGRPLREAVYAGVVGPAYETPAEVKMLRTLGAGLVGMSTVHEVIAARHAGLSVLGLSVVANRAAGSSHDRVRHEHVEQVAAASSKVLGCLLQSLVAALPLEKAADLRRPIAE